jgi:hypothetical protein
MLPQVFTQGPGAMYKSPEERAQVPPPCAVLKCLQPATIRHRRCRVCGAVGSMHTAHVQHSSPLMAKQPPQCTRGQCPTCRAAAV